VDDIEREALRCVVPPGAAVLDLSRSNVHLPEGRSHGSLALRYGAVDRPISKRDFLRGAAALYGAMGLSMPAAMSNSRKGAAMDEEVAGIVGPAIAALAPANEAGGLAAAIRIDGRTVFFNRGVADERTEQPITPDSLFNLASARKVFEATLVAEAVLRGELSLDDPVNKYVGELQGAYVRQVTIGELATHTSGLLLPTDHPPWPDDSYSLAQFLNMLNTWTPEHGEQPGKQRIYTHAGYVLLQLALERRYGTPIGALIESRILKPLGMNSTLVPERGPDNRAVMDAQMMRRTVQGYAADGMPIGAPGNQQSYFDFPGTGQMFSSARDLAILVAASLGDEAVDPQIRKALQFTQHEFFRVDAQYGQAMAWEVNDLSGPTIVDKPGGLNNASAYLGLVPERKVGLVILSNRGDIHPYDVARTTILPALAKLPQQPTKP
jgi:beta-lactamase class C